MVRVEGWTRKDSEGGDGGMCRDGEILGGSEGEVGGGGGEVGGGGEGEWKLDEAGVVVKKDGLDEAGVERYQEKWRG